MTPALLILLATPALGVELRGRVDTRHPMTGQFFPRPNAEVVLLFNGRPVRRTFTGPDGFYYLHDAQPGRHELEVNRSLRLPLYVHPKPYQDVPPILIR